MAEVVLSSAVRSNLLSLQNTAQLLGKTQERLATGLRVNSALDDPTAFFTASSLNSRAGDLNRLLDSVGLAVQTLKAADNGISSITKLVESAQATARQALQSPAAAATPASVAGTGTIGADDAAIAVASGAADFSTDADLSALDGQSISINGNVVYTFTASATGQVAALTAAIDGVAGISATVVGTTLEIEADANTTSFEISFSAGAVGTALGLTAGTYDPTNTDLAALDGETLDITIGTNPTLQIAFGTGAGEVSNLVQLNAELASLAGGTASVVGGQLTITAGNGTDSVTVLASDADVNTAFGVTNTTTAPVPGVSANRTALETQFNNLLTQITDLANDAGFNGINLLRGDNLQVTFNEDGSSSLTITGVNFDAAGLGISALVAGDFQTNAGIEASLTELSDAVSTLRTQAATFGSGITVVETRQQFTKNLINTLQSGAANLTLADTNEEGANMLALQTRQQLSSVALSLAAQADQNVLRLF